MPKKVDPLARRRELAEALWRVTRRDGWDAISLRQVAAEAGVSMGLVQHYFSTKDEMLSFALDQIGADFQERITQRITALPTPREPRRVVEIVLAEMMPREGGSRAEVEAAVAFAGRAARHPEIAGNFVAKGNILTTYVAGCIRDSWAANRADGGVDAELAAAGLLAMAEGLIAHTLLGRHTPSSAWSVMVTALDLVFGVETASG